MSEREGGREGGREREGGVRGREGGVGAELTFTGGGGSLNVFKFLR